VILTLTIALIQLTPQPRTDGFVFNQLKKKGRPSNLPLIFIVSETFFLPMIAATRFKECRTEYTFVTVVGDSSGVDGNCSRAVSSQSRTSDFGQ